LIVGDVGQNAIEEVDVVRKGGNYGWRIKEGSFCFEANGADDGFVTDSPFCGTSGLIGPVAEYDHDEGRAILGGFVYRGKTIRSLAGHYVFGDYARTFNNDGRLFYSEKTNLGSGRAAKSAILELALSGQPALDLSLLGFGQDANGEIYVLGNRTGIPSGSTGVVLKIVP